MQEFGQMPATMILRGVPGGATAGSTATAAIGGSKESLGSLPAALAAEWHATVDRITRTTMDKRWKNMANLPFDQRIAATMQLREFFPHCGMMGPVVKPCPRSE